MPKGRSKRAKKPRTEPEYRRPFTPHMVRRYTDAERVAALVLLDKNDGNVDKTARELGIPQQTMWTWASGSRHPEAQRLRQQCAGDMQAMARGAVYQLLDSVTDENAIRRAPLAQRVAALGKSFEIMRVLEGKPSAIHVDSQAPINPLLDLRGLPADELEKFLATLDKLQSAGCIVNAGGTGPVEAQEVCGEDVSGRGTGSDTDPGPGHTRHLGALPSGEGGADTAATHPHATGHLEVNDRDGTLSALGVD